MAPGVWGAQRTSAPSGVVYRGQCTRPFPVPGPPTPRLSAKPHTIRPQHAFWCQVPCPCVAVATKALPPTQHLSSPDQRKKGFLKPSCTCRKNLRCSAAPSLASGGPRAPVRMPSHLTCSCPLGLGPVCGVSFCLVSGQLSLSRGCTWSLLGWHSHFALNIYPSLPSCLLEEYASWSHI